MSRYSFDKNKNNLVLNDSSLFSKKKALICLPDIKYSINGFQEIMCNTNKANLKELSLVKLAREAHYSHTINNVALNSYQNVQELSKVPEKAKFESSLNKKKKIQHNKKSKTHRKHENRNNCKPDKKHLQLANSETFTNHTNDEQVTKRNSSRQKKSNQRKRSKLKSQSADHITKKDDSISTLSKSLVLENSMDSSQILENAFSVNYKREKSQLRGSQISNLVSEISSRLKVEPSPSNSHSKRENPDSLLKESINHQHSSNTCHKSYDTCKNLKYFSQDSILKKLTEQTASSVVSDLSLNCSENSLKNSFTQNKITTPKQLLSSDPIPITNMLTPDKLVTDRQNPFVSKLLNSYLFESKPILDSSENLDQQESTSSDQSCFHNFGQQEVVKIDGFTFVSFNSETEINDHLNSSSDKQRIKHIRPMKRTNKMLELFFETDTMSPQKKISSFKKTGFISGSQYIIEPELDTKTKYLPKVLVKSIAETPPKYHLNLKQTSGRSYTLPTVSDKSRESVNKELKKSKRYKFKLVRLDKYRANRALTALISSEPNVKQDKPSIDCDFSSHTFDNGSKASTKCSQPGCRYGCVCHLCKLSSSQLEMCLSENETLEASEDKVLCGVDINSTSANFNQNNDTFIKKPRTSERLKGRHSIGHIDQLKSLIYFDTSAWIGNVRKRKKSKSSCFKSYTEDDSDTNSNQTQSDLQCSRSVPISNLRKSPTRQYFDKSEDSDIAHISGSIHSNNSLPITSQASSLHSLLVMNTRVSSKINSNSVSGFQQSTELLSQPNLSNCENNLVVNTNVDIEKKSKISSKMSNNYTLNSQPSIDDICSPLNDLSVDTPFDHSTIKPISSNTKVNVSLLRNPNKTQMIVLQRKPQRHGVKNIPLLLEIKSNCDWSSIRYPIFKGLSHSVYLYPPSGTFSYSNFSVEILEKPKKPTTIPDRYTEIPVKSIFSIRIVIKSNTNFFSKPTVQFSSGDAFYQFFNSFKEAFNPLQNLKLIKVKPSGKSKIIKKNKSLASGQNPEHLSNSSCGSNQHYTSLIPTSDSDYFKILGSASKPFNPFNPDSVVGISGLKKLTVVSNQSEQSMDLTTLPNPPVYCNNKNFNNTSFVSSQDQDSQDLLHLTDNSLNLVEEEVSESCLSLKPNVSAVVNYFNIDNNSPILNSSSQQISYEKFISEKQCFLDSLNLFSSSKNSLHYKSLVHNKYSFDDTQFCKKKFPPDSQTLIRKGNTPSIPPRLVVKLDEQHPEYLADYNQSSHFFETVNDINCHDTHPPLSVVTEEKVTPDHSYALSSTDIESSSPYYLESHKPCVDNEEKASCADKVSFEDSEKKLDKDCPVDYNYQQKHSTLLPCLISEDSTNTEDIEDIEVVSVGSDEDWSKVTFEKPTPDKIHDDEEKSKPSGNLETFKHNVLERERRLNLRFLYKELENTVLNYYGYGLKKDKNWTKIETLIQAKKVIQKLIEKENAQIKEKISLLKTQKDLVTRLNCLS